MKERITTIVPRALTALFLAVALSLPNYSVAFEAWHDQDDYLSSLYDQYLSEFGAQEAHAFAPVIALPAAIAAAGITPEMAGAACLAIFTAVTAISVSDVWDKMPTDQKARYDGSLANFGLGMGMVSGNYTFDPDDQNQPPEPKGPGGEKMNAAIIALCTGAGVAILKDLADAAGYLIDFAASPAGEDENGYPTGLGAVSNDTRIMATDDAGEAVAVPSISLSSFESLCGYTLPVKDGYIPMSFKFSVYKGNLSVQSNYVNIGAQLVVSDFGDSVADPSASYSYKMLSAVDEPFTYITMTYRSEKPSPVSWSAQYTTSGFSAGLSKTDAYFCTDAPFSSKVSLVDLLYKAANAPAGSSDMLEQVAQAGPGTEAAQQIVNNYVTNNIANSEMVVTVPSSLEDTADYDKVVTDPAPGPDPNPGPDPDPGGDETTAQKAEKLAKLPVQQLFPFCLIYDIQLLVEHVAGGGVSTMADDSLVFEFNVGFGYFDSPLVIDLTDYKDMRGAFHMAFDVMLVVGLLYFSISLFLKARSD